jgi:hypothetical protein
MNIQEYRQLQAERGALAGLINALPVSRVIERLGLESRKAEIEAELASRVVPPPEPARVRLTFRGKPIVGSHGIFAEFGAAVVTAFADAVAAIGASQVTQLGARGAIPNRDAYRLLITGTALGSFGFELEEPPSVFSEPSPVAAAIEQAKAIMRASLASDDDLADAVSDADPRALEALRTFLKAMADQDAVCTLDFRGEVFRFADVGQVRRSWDRLGQDNIHEDTRRIEGAFQGVLPKRRTFEFADAESQEIIAGKVGAGIPDASAINRVLDQPTTIEVQVTRVGSGSPRYVLLRCADLPGEERMSLALGASAPPERRPGPAAGTEEEH